MAGYVKTPYGPRRKKVAEKPPSKWVSGDDVVIQFGPIKCKFLSGYPRALEKAMKAPYPGYFFTPQFKHGGWDGHYHFITKAGYFPTGLLPMVYAILRTGRNPLVPDGPKHQVLKSPVEAVKVVIPSGCHEYFSPNFVKFYLNSSHVLDDLGDDGHFTVPTDRMSALIQVENKNPFSKKLLDFYELLLDQEDENQQEDS